MLKSSVFVFVIIKFKFSFLNHVKGRYISYQDWISQVSWMLSNQPTKVACICYIAITFLGSRSGLYTKF